MPKTIFIYLFIMIISLHAQNDKVLVTAHRGASAYAPENTLSAVELAIKMKADYAEIDVQETADGEIILLHDGSLKRTTGTDMNIWQMEYKELDTLDAGSWFSGKFKSESIPSLTQLLDSVRGRIKLNIELKTNGHEKELAERTVKIIKEKNFHSECILTSFSYSQLKKVKEIEPDLRTGLIFSKMPADINIFTNNSIDLLSVHYSLVNEVFMKSANDAGKEVHVWTVNDEDEMKRLIKLGVKSIITNYPDKLRQIQEY
jgi:glycerophosphoryl diester phosphodiesterase